MIALHHSVDLLHRVFPNQGFFFRTNWFTAYLVRMSLAVIGSCGQNRTCVTLVAVVVVRRCIIRGLVSIKLPVVPAKLRNISRLRKKPSIAGRRLATAEFTKTPTVRELDLNAIGACHSELQGQLSR